MKFADFFVLWSIGSDMWERDHTAVYMNLDSHPWLFTHNPLLVPLIRYINYFLLFYMNLHFFN